MKIKTYKVTKSIDRDDSERGEEKNFTFSERFVLLHDFFFKDKIFVFFT